MIEHDEDRSPWITIVIGVLHVYSFIFDIVTFPFYFLLQQPWKRSSHRVRAAAVSRDDKQITYRTVDRPGRIYVLMLQKHVDTLEKMYRKVTQLHTTKPCLGTREILGEEDEVQPNGKVFKKYKMGDYKWRNYLEVEQEAKFFGRGMRELGVEPLDRVVIFAETRAEWTIAARGLIMQNVTIVTIYSTLGDAGIEHAVSETEVKTIITSHELLPKLRNIMKSIPNVKTIIFFEDQLSKKTNMDGFGDVHVHPYKRIVKNGSESNFRENPPTPSDIAFIMYTSGSTGTPKGVLLSHQNCIATMECYCDLEIFPSDVAIGFLPLAHIFELLAESLGSLRGIPIGYSSANTFLDASTKVMRGSKGDASVLQPTIMTTVPLLLDRIRKVIVDKLNQKSPLERALFHMAYHYKLRWMRRGFTNPMLDALVFKKVAKIMGGKLRCMITGGAPLSPDTHDQIRAVLCCAVVQGYGMTETTAGGFISSVRDWSTGRVGAPSALIELRLVNWEEGNYRVTNKPYPQGEILIGGEVVSPGYFKNQEKTAEEFFDEDEVRWVRTGDIGEVHPDGVLKIIDRKKDLVKLQHGEYVSLGKVESEMKTSPLVEIICVYGESSKLFCVALVVPNAKALKELAASLNIRGEFEELCANPEIEKAFLNEFSEHAKKTCLQRFEIPQRIKLISDVWSPSNNLLTAIFKLKRKEIQERYKAELEEMYAEK